MVAIIDKPLGGATGPYNVTVPVLRLTDLRSSRHACTRSRYCWQRPCTAGGWASRARFGGIPYPKVIAALDDAFELALWVCGALTVPGTSSRCDVSGSMGWGCVNGAEAITPAVGAAALALQLLRTEPVTTPLAFTSEHRAAGDPRSDVARRGPSMPRSAPPLREHGLCGADAVGHPERGRYRRVRGPHRLRDMGW